MPDELRGRVMAVYATMFMGVQPIGALIAGGVAKHIGAPRHAGGVWDAVFCWGAWFLFSAWCMRHCGGNEAARSYRLGGIGAVEPAGLVSGSQRAGQAPRHGDGVDFIRARGWRRLLGDCGASEQTGSVAAASPARRVPGSGSRRNPASRRSQDLQGSCIQASPRNF